MHLVQASKSLGGFGSFGGGRLKDLGGEPSEPSQAEPGQPGQSGLGGSEVQGHSAPSQRADLVPQGQVDESPNQVPFTATAQVAQVLGAALGTMRSSTSSGILVQD